MKNTIIFPSTNQWASTRTITGSNLTDENCVVILSKPIFDLQQVLLRTDVPDNPVVINYGGQANGNVNLKDYTSEEIARNLVIETWQQMRSDGANIGYLPTGLPYNELYQAFEDVIARDNAYYYNYFVPFEAKLRQNAILELDITPFVVEIAKYQTLKTKTTSQEIVGTLKNNTMYYVRYENVLHIVNGSFGSVFNKRYIFNQLIQSAAYTQFGRLVTLLKAQHLSGDIKNSTLIGQIGNNNNPMYAQFRITYTPLGEDSKIDVPKLEPQAVAFSIPYNQQQNIISSIGQGRQVQLTANMMGAEKQEVVRVLDDLSQMRPMYSTYFDGKDNWNLTVHELTFANERIVDKETWSKNWASQSRFVGVNRQARTWDTPANILERNLKINEYLYITSDLSFTIAPRNRKLLTRQALQHLLKSLAFDIPAYDTECNLMWIYGRKDSELDLVTEGAVVSCSAYGFGNTLVFTGKTLDNLAAGKQRYKLDGSSDTFCPDVYYCDDDGTAELMRFQCGSAINGFNSDQFPAAQRGYTNYLDTNAATVITLFDTDELVIEKDPAEQINFTYLLSMLTHEANLIVGTGFANSNQLVRNVGAGNMQPVKYWVLDRPLPHSAQVCTSLFGAATEVTSVELQQSAPYRINTTELTVTFNVPVGKAGICITDMDNNILLCQNAYPDGGTITYKFVLTRDYDLIQQTYDEKNKTRR